MNRFGRKSAVNLLVLAAILLVSGVAFVASGVAKSDNGATGRSAAEPLGALSAAPPGGDTAPKQQGEVLGQTGGGDTGNTGNAGASGGSGGGGSSRLPFTGFVAIPLLVAGAGLLMVGVGLRRRTLRTAES